MRRLHTDEWGYDEGMGRKLNVEKLKRIEKNQFVWEFDLKFDYMLIETECVKCGVAGLA